MYRAQSEHIVGAVVDQIKHRYDEYITNLHKPLMTFVYIVAGLLYVPAESLLRPFPTDNPVTRACDRALKDAMGTIERYYTIAKLPTKSRTIGASVQCPIEKALGTLTRLPSFAKTEEKYLSTVNQPFLEALEKVAQIPSTVFASGTSAHFISGSLNSLRSGGDDNDRDGSVHGGGHLVDLPKQEDNNATVEPPSTPPAAAPSVDQVTDHMHTIRDSFSDAIDVIMDSAVQRASQADITRAIFSNPGAGGIVLGERIYGAIVKAHQLVVRRSGNDTIEQRELVFQESISGLFAEFVALIMSDNEYQHNSNNRSVYFQNKNRTEYADRILQMGRRFTNIRRNSAGMWHIPLGPRAPRMVQPPRRQRTPSDEPSRRTSPVAKFFTRKNSDGVGSYFSSD
jgi:hypothetical protein